MQKTLESAWDWIVSGSWLPGAKQLVAAAIIIGGSFALAWLLRTWLERVRRTAGAQASLVYIVEKVGSYLIIGVGLLAGLTTLGLDLASFSLFAGATGVGLGLGLQGVVKEFVSGLVLIFDRTIRVGDFVELKGGVRGSIAEIGPRATRLRTNNNLNVVVPNSLMIQDQVTNWTFNETTRRLHVPFSVAEEADKAKVREVVIAAARALPFTMPDDEDRRTQVWLVGFAGDGMDFELIVWPTLDSARHPASMHAAYTWAVHDALAAAGIDNSAPQLDLRLTRMFGRTGEEALDALNLTHHEERRRKAHLSPPAPNDAAEAVVGDMARDVRQRAEEAAGGAGSREERTKGNT
jgi:small-conductance mechanosensitive channel